MSDMDPNRHRFGYAAVVEQRAIRERLLAEGHPNDYRLSFLVAAEYERAHANDPTYAETSARFAARRGQAPPQLTVEEWAHLAALLEGANDPTGQAIRAKAVRAAT